jgi:NAD(P)-dependent dehydrogenase (short-subunit alcohol dehydrogenase family)
MGPHHQHLLGERQARRPRKGRLLFGEARSDRVDPRRRVGNSQDGITVNAICPGLVDTPLIQSQLADLAAMHGLTTDEALDKIYLSLVPQKRMLDPREIATMVRYLVSEEGRGITGQAINVSAGWIMH